MPFRSVIIHSSKKEDLKSKWVQSLHKRKGMNKTAVAIANKNARIIWSIVKNNTEYKTREELAVA